MSRAVYQKGHDAWLSRGEEETEVCAVRCRVPVRAVLSTLSASLIEAAPRQPDDLPRSAAAKQQTRTDVRLTRPPVYLTIQRCMMSAGVRRLHCFRSWPVLDYDGPPFLSFRKQHTVCACRGVCSVQHSCLRACGRHAAGTGEDVTQ